MTPNILRSPKCPWGWDLLGYLFDARCVLGMNNILLEACELMVYERDCLRCYAKDAAGGGGAAGW
jgi:hypothetical protein